jgi:hypothetical protein
MSNIKHMTVKVSCETSHVHCYGIDIACKKPHKGNGDMSHPIPTIDIPISFSPPFSARGEITSTPGSHSRRTEGGDTAYLAIVAQRGRASGYSGLSDMGSNPIDSPPWSGENEIAFTVARDPSERRRDSRKTDGTAHQLNGRAHPDLSPSRGAGSNPAGGPKFDWPGGIDDRHQCKR